MPRNAEVIRQWTILREIEQARSAGVTIDDLASQCSVTTRTIRRDLQALEEAGFPIYDDKSRDDGRTRWILNGQAFKGLSAGLTLSELCALYFSRSLAESLAGTPFKADVESAFEKLTTALTPHMQQFLDQLPRVLSTKTLPQIAADATSSPGRTKIEARALEATLHQRQATILYHSKSSDREAAKCAFVSSPRRNRRQVRRLPQKRNRPDAAAAFASPRLTQVGGYGLSIGSRPELTNALRTASLRTQQQFACDGCDKTTRRANHF